LCDAGVFGGLGSFDVLRGRGRRGDDVLDFWVDLNGDLNRWRDAQRRGRGG
jgi:hypothetical protein